MACILLGVENGAAEFCPGQKVTLFGFNFPDQLSDMRVTFTTGDSSVEGMPTRVVNQRRNIESTTVESSLEVLIPSGVSTGIVELFCHGISAGAAGFDSCPVVYAVTLGANADSPFLFYFPNLGFQQGGSRVTIYGLNLADAQEVVLDDGGGNTGRIPASTFIFNQVGGGFAGQLPTGYETISFDLNGGGNSIEFPFRVERENLGMRVRGPAGTSNRVEIPVSTDAASVAIGAVINTMRPPVGVATGPVRIEYKTYEIVVDASWTMEFEWCVDLCDDEASWFAAKPRDEDPTNHGKFDITCGVLAQGLSPGGESRRLMPGGGAIKTFVWDPQCDPNFRALNDEIGEEGVASREWTVNMRCRPIPEAGQRNFIDHVWQAPPFVYYDLEDRESESVAALRGSQIVESFDNDANEDFFKTDAFWGPPENPGFVEGLIDTSDLLQFGEGEAVVILEELDLAGLPEPETIIGQFYLIDTDRVSITHNILRDIALPGDPPTLITDSSNYFLTDDGTPNGNSVVNPGEDLFEFHIAYFEIAPGTEIRIEGERPLVFRVAGRGDEPSEFDTSVRISGILDASGGAGADGGFLGGAGGLSVAGGGSGGAGATLEAANPTFDGQIRTFIEASRGENHGGHPGETPASVDPDPAAMTSRVAGSGGGGGGHRSSGGESIFGSTTGAPSEYRLPIPGPGGPARGDFTQIVLSSGSGGGGGGGSFSKVSAATGIFFVGVGGGGGGGGGGTIKFTARGSVDVPVGGSIRCNGGIGGSGVVPPRDQQGFPPNGTERGAPGGGGSGGTIHLQATGSVTVSNCGNLQTNGGAGGTGGASGRQSGGVGSSGFVRIESGGGGTPLCSALQASSTLRSTLRDRGRGTEILLAVGTGAVFPDSGIVQIEDEFIRFTARNGDDLLGLTRAFSGTTEESHSSGVEVQYQGPIVPRDDSAVLLGGGVLESPDELDFGLGRDGILHLTFVQSIDPDTGDALLDTDTGRPVSVWTFDTDAGTLTSPTGAVRLRARHRETRPGFLDLLGLVIEEDIVLRGVGSSPLDISVRDRAEIAGTIDVSGSTGGLLRYTQGGSVPLPGTGGAPGAGGGAGGSGGTVEFLDGNPDNKEPLNINVISGEEGGLPLRLALLNAVNQNGQLGFEPTTPPSGGGSLGGLNCDPNCLDTAGGGGGGGNLRGGGDGSAVITNPLFDAAFLAGDGGGAVGFDDFRFGGGLFLIGGIGGGGGGSVPHVTAAYRDGGIAGSFPFRGTALFAPGTGGGGGGGILRLAAANMHLRRGARLLARGGDAFQSIDLGGNGGGGGGGNIFLQVANTFTSEDGVTIDVSAGKANRLPRHRGVDSPLVYEGNFRERRVGSAPAEPGEVPGLPSFGGAGGSASNGRIRIEAAAGSGLVSRGVNSSVSSGPLLRDVVVSVGTSRIFRTGVGAGLAASTHSLEFDPPRVNFNSFQQPAGTSVVVLWEGARDSRDIQGATSDLTGLVRDPRMLEYSEFVRFSVYFVSNFVNRQTQSIQSVTLPIRVRTGECLPFGF